MFFRNPLPSDWNACPLGDIIDIERNSISPETIEVGTYYVGLEHISGDDGSLLEISCDENGISSSKFKFNNNHVLFGKLRPYLKKIAKPDFSGICSTDLLPVRPKGNCNRTYLFYLLRHPNFIKEATLRCAGANLPRISPKVFEKIKIPLPPLPVQKKIAAILDKAEKLREWRREADALTDEYLKSVFLEMFGDPVRNEKGWEMLKLSEVGKLQRGKSKHRPRNAPELLGGKYPLIQTGDVANLGTYIRGYHQTYSELGLKQSRMWKTGTLCITIAANIANTGILTFDSCFPDSIVGFTPNEKVKTEYVHFWMTFLQKTLEMKAPESAQKNINLKILSKLDIPVPPFTLQNKFTTIVEKVEQMKGEQEKSKEQIDDLFNALVQKAFKGELVA